MHRPEDLFDAIENDAIAWLLARVVFSETAVIGRMPIFGRENEIEFLLQFICHWDDFITLRDGKGAARHKIILEVDENQRTRRVF
jgi:hypothetical protein